MSVPAFLVIALPMFAAPLAYLSGHIGRSQGMIRPTPGRARITALVVLLAMWVPFALAVQQVAHGPLTIAVGVISLRVDGLTLLLAAVALVLGTLAVLFAGPDLYGEDGEEKFYAAVLVLIGAIIGVGAAGDLFNLWLWFETMAVTSYVLVPFYRQRPAALEAAVKYLVQGAVGSLIVLVGIALVLFRTGTLDLAALRTAADHSGVLLAAGACFVVGFGVKAALVPLHTWLPDAHAEAPTAVSALLSGIVIQTGLAAMVRTLSALAPSVHTWGWVLAGTGALNMMAGNLLALRQVQVKRLLAFSSVSQMGYIALGAGIALVTGQALVFQGAFFHILTHALMKTLAFLAAGALLYVLHAETHGPLVVDDLSGAWQRYPLPAFALSVAVLGLAGLPPLAGFMSKWQIFAAGIEAGNTVIALLVVFAALNTTLSFAYYGRLAIAVYRRPPQFGGGRSLPVAMAVPLGALSLAVIAIGMWPQLVSWLTAPAGRALGGGL